MKLLQFLLAFTGCLPNTPLQIFIGLAMPKYMHESFAGGVCSPRSLSEQDIVVLSLAGGSNIVTSSASPFLGVARKANSQKRTISIVTEIAVVLGLCAYCGRWVNAGIANSSGLALCATEDLLSCSRNAARRAIHVRTNTQTCLGSAQTYTIIWNV